MTRESQTSLSSPSCIPNPPQSSPIDAGYSQYRAGEGAVSFQRRLAGKRLLRAADRYAYRLWKHCLFCRDCLERRDIYIFSSGPPRYPSGPRGQKPRCASRASSRLIEPASELRVGPDRGHCRCVAEIFHVVIVQRIPWRQLQGGRTFSMLKANSSSGNATAHVQRRFTGSASSPLSRTPGRQVSCWAGTASRSPGKRASRVPSAIRASSRASGAPRQWWRP